MNHRKVLLRLAISSLLFVVIATAADAPQLTFKFHAVSFPGAAATTAYGVNNSGVIVGQYLDQKGVAHGFMLDHGKGTIIDDPHGTGTLCQGINSTGAIVGQYADDAGNNHGFLYQNGKFTDLHPEPLSGASGINDKGEVVGGMAECDFCQQHGYLWNGHTFKRLDVPGAMWTGAGGINNQETITIIAPDENDHYNSYLYSQGKYAKVKVPGAFETLVEDINNSGDLVLTWDDKKQNNHAALRYSGKFYKFDYQNAPTYAFGLNDHRLIVGDAATLAGGAFRASY